MATVWDLIQSGQFEAACAAADSEAAGTQGMLPYRNKVYALLHLGRLKEAVDLCEMIIKRENAESASDFAKLGVAYWLMRMHDTAIDSWQRGSNTKYTDAAGGVRLPALLYYAGVRRSDEGLQKEAVRRLRKLSKGRRMCNWPGPVASFLLGNLSEPEFLSALTTVPILRDREACQAYFFLGVRCLENQAADHSAEFMRKACSQGPSSYLEAEYYLSKAESGGDVGGAPVPQ